MFDIKEELKKLPDRPGVYLMYNQKDEIIYVGKAISLKNRVRQYFRSLKDKSEKIKRMIINIKRFEIIITTSELEALILENNLIKEHRPRYNTMLRDDKTYPYIKVSINETFPRIFLTRQVKKDAAKYYGPFPSAYAVKNIIDLVTKSFMLRDCKRNLPRDIKKERPCLNYYIKQCKAPCYAYVDEYSYKEDVKKAIDFLNGDFNLAIREVKSKMEEFSKNFDYENAAKQRDLLNSLYHISQKQKVSENSLDNKDVIALVKDKDIALVQIFFIRNGKLLDKEHHFINIQLEEDEKDILESFIKQFYAGTPFIPSKILLPYELPSKEVITEWLSNKKEAKVSIFVPKGENKAILDLAMKNASLLIEKDKDKVKKENLKFSKIKNSLSTLLNLDKLERIEAYDISHLGGKMSVGSMVVFENFKKKKSEYRKFRIKTVESVNDTACIYEVLKRRFLRSLEQDKNFLKLPDLVLIDGGVPQFNSAKKLMEDLGLNIKICSMVKDDKHRSRNLYYNNENLSIKDNKELFVFITEIQDEVHRFALDYHKTLSKKELFSSDLDKIKGIGGKRKNILLSYFKDIEKIKRASIEELESVSGISKTLAEDIYNYFN